MTSPKQNPGYVDASYLQQLAENLRQTKQRTYDLMQIAEGHHVLDVGCGPATDTIALAKIVGTSGRVVGIDYDEDFITTANQKAREAEVAAYTIHKLCNAEDLPFDDNSFDACRSERVFQHLENPMKVLSEMVRVSKPGAWIVLTDPDWTTFSIDTPYHETEWKLRQVIGSKNRTMGRELYRLMREAQLKSVSVEGVFFHTTNLDQWHFLAHTDQVVQIALEKNLVTTDEIEQYLGLLRQRSEQHLFYGHAMGIIASGQKPEQ